MSKNLLITPTLILLIILSATAQKWETSFETAKQIASEESRNIVLVFQGSDWCAPCIKLDKEVWKTEAYQTFAKDHFVMLQADFPRKKNNQLTPEQQAHNNQLAEKYNKNGIFPLVLVMDKEGKVLGETSYEKMTPEQYIRLLTSFEH